MQIMWAMVLLVRYVLISYTTNNKQINVWNMFSGFWQLCSQLLVRTIYSWTFWSCRMRKIWQNKPSVIYRYSLFFSGLLPSFENGKEKWVPEMIHHCLMNTCLLKPKLISETCQGHNETSHSADYWNAVLCREGCPICGAFCIHMEKCKEST